MTTPSHDDPPHPASDPGPDPARTRLRAEAAGLPLSADRPAGVEPVPLVLLHALRQGPGAWAGVVDALPAALAERSLARPLIHVPWLDGLAPGDPEPYSVERSAHRLAEQIDDLAGSHDIADVVGLSLGAVTGLAVADLYRERVRSLVLSGGLIYPPAWFIRAEKRAAMAITRGRTDVGSNRAQVGAAYDELAKLDLRPAMRRLRVPTLVLCGSRDLPNLPEARLEAALNGRARLRIVPRAGHVLNKTHPEVLAGILADHLREVDHLPPGDPHPAAPVPARERLERHRARIRLR